MKIIYFSSTGNSLYVAKCIGGELCSMSGLVKNNVTVVKDEEIGLIFPVYWISVPAYVRNFLENVELDCNYLFGIMTYGDNMFGAIHDLDSIELKNGHRFDYIKAVKMTENYLPMYEMKKEIEKAKGYGTDAAIKSVCNDIKNHVKSISKISWFSKLLTNNYKKKHCVEMGAGESAGFSVSDECVACGQCAKICPMQNIKIIDRKPVFGKTCADCLGCIQNCPQSAIHTKKEKSSERYRNPNIKISELYED